MCFPRECAWSYHSNFSTDLSSSSLFLSSSECTLPGRLPGFFGIHLIHLTRIERYQSRSINGYWLPWETCRCTVHSNSNTELSSSSLFLGSSKCTLLGRLPGFFQIHLIHLTRIFRNPSNPFDKKTSKSLETWIWINSNQSYSQNGCKWKAMSESHVKACIKQ